MTTIQIRRGEIYYADLDPVVGSETGKTRPVLIITVPEILIQGNCFFTPGLAKKE